MSLSSVSALFGGGPPVGATSVGATTGGAASGAGASDSAALETPHGLEGDFLSALLQAFRVTGSLPDALEGGLGGDAFAEAPEAHDGPESEVSPAGPGREERSRLDGALGSPRTRVVAVSSSRSSLAASVGRTPGEGLSEDGDIDHRRALAIRTVRGVGPMEDRVSASTTAASGSDDLPEVKYRPAVVPASHAPVVAPSLGRQGDFGADDAARSADSSALDSSEPSSSAGDSVTFAVAPRSAASADVLTADRSWDRLDPELRSRLETVVHRMDTEFGHDVRLIEGYRSPARQAHLFQQGRVRPGPVVTWTLDSEHFGGRAVDVQVDGSYEVNSGYTRLQQVAAEEGLRTLGMRDPGHLELPNSPSFRAVPVKAAQEAPLQVQETPQALSSQAFETIARPAQVAGIARIAQAARVANIAPVARPGQRQSTASVEAAHSHAAPPTPARPDAPTPLLIPDPEPREPLSPPRRGLTFAESGRGTVLGEEGRSNERAAGRAEATVAPQASGEPTPDLGPQARLAALDSLSVGVEGSVARTAQLSSTPGLDTMSRVESVLLARERATTGFPSRVSVRLDGVAGSVDQLRVGLFGSAVTADLDVADADTAAHIRSRVSELHSALESRGLELGSLGVTTSRAELASEAILGGRMDVTPDLLRSLLSTAAGDSSRDSSGRERWEQQRTDDDGTGSDRPRREPDKEE